MRRSRLSWAFAAVAVVTAIACGTGTPSAGGDHDLPTAVVGPFRVLRVGETPKTAPRILTALRQSDSLAWERIGSGAAEAATGIEAAPPLFPRIELPAPTA